MAHSHPYLLPISIYPTLPKPSEITFNGQSEPLTNLPISIYPTLPKPSEMTFNSQSEPLTNLHIPTYISDLFPYSINKASKRLNICTTIMKKICRKHGINRWPYRKYKAINSLLEKCKNADKIKELNEGLRQLTANPNLSLEEVLPNHFNEQQYKVRSKKKGKVSSKKKGKVSSKKKSKILTRRFPKILPRIVRDERLEQLLENDEDVAQLLVSLCN